MDEVSTLNGREIVAYLRLLGPLQSLVMKPSSDPPRPPPFLDTLAALSL